MFHLHVYVVRRKKSLNVVLKHQDDSQQALGQDSSFGLLPSVLRPVLKTFQVGPNSFLRAS